MMPSSLSFTNDERLTGDAAKNTFQSIPEDAFQDLREGCKTIKPNVRLVIL